MLHQFYFHRSKSLIVCLLVFAPSILKAQTFSWAKQIGGSNASVNAPMGQIKIDVNGNSFYIISCTGTVDIDPGPATVNVNNFTGVIKFNNAGNFLWAKEIPGAPELDQSGNLFVASSFTGTKDFDPGPGVYNLTSFGYKDIAVTKYDNNGNLIWAKQIGGSYDDQAGGIAVNLQGDVYVTGYFGYGGSISPINTCDFDPDPGVTYNLTNIGGKDGFILALDVNGQFISVVQKGTAADESVNGILVDANGNLIYVIYYYPNPLNMYLEKTDANYNLFWSVHLGTSNLQLAPLSLDLSGNILISGGYGGTVDFDPGPGTVNYTASTVQDPFTEKFDANGNFLWAKVIRANGFANGFVSDATGDVYSTGYFNGNGNIDFDPGPGTYNIKTSAIAMYVQKLSAAGNFAWAVRIGGEAKTSTMGKGIAVNNSNEILTAFDFNGSIDVDPGSGKTTLKSSGTKDMVIHKMAQSIPSPQKATDLIVSETLPLKTIKTYPNPNKGSFYIDIPAIGENAKLRIFDMTGKMILSRSFNGKTEQRLFISGEKIKAAGVYFLEIKNGERIFKAKVTIQ